MHPTTTLPRPWLIDAQGGRVRGEPLEGDVADILSLQDEAMAARAALVAMSRHLQHATAVGRPAPIVADMRARLSSPAIGDLVVEVTSGYRQARARAGDWYRALGVLLLHRRELVDPGEGPGDELTDEAWYIQYGPAPDDVCRWANSDFEVVPWSRDVLPGF